MSAPKIRERAYNLRLLATLATLMGFASISTDFYLPAMPAMALDLHAGSGQMALTISTYLIGFSAGQLLWGPFADRWGRRMPIVVGMALFVLGSLGCALSHDASQIILSRMIQALGACAGVVLGRAMVRDLYEGPRAAQMLSTLMLVMAVAPLIGPWLGGQVQALAGWRAIFALMAAVGLVTTVAVLTLDETLPPDRRNTEKFSRSLASYAQLLGNRELLGFAGAGGFLYGGIYAYVAGTPFAYITYYHVPARDYGLLFGAGVLGIMVTNFTNARLVVRVGSTRLLRLGSAAAAVAGVIFALCARTDFGGLLGLVAPLFVYSAMIGFIIANSLAGALTRYPHRAGAVSALVGAIHYGSGIFGSALVGFLADGTPWPMGLIVGIGGLGCALCAWFVVQRPAKPALIQRTNPTAVSASPCEAIQTSNISKLD